jgi:hypothetical protein
LISSLVVVLLLGGGVWWLSRAWSEERGGPHIPGEGRRITVEVLNGTDVDGLAREMTRRLRAKGIDVVFFGTADVSDQDSTMIIVRGVDSTVASVVREAVGVGRVTIEPDPRLLLDVTVILGRDAAPDRRLDP